MNEPVKARRIVMGWRAALNDEESRAYLQTRLVVLSSLMFWSFVAFLSFVTVLYQAYPYLEPRLNRVILVASAGGLTCLAVLWRVFLVRRTLSIAALNGIDAFYAFGTGAFFALGGYLAPDLTPAPYSCLLFTALTVLARATVVPSTGKRTLVLAIVAFLPFLAAGFALAFGDWKDLPGPAIVSAIVLIGFVVVLLAATGSETSYGLRREASAAMQLGQYTLDRKIGEGGMGTVYRANHVLLRRPTAIKLLHPDKLGAETIDRFEREVQHMSQLTHPNTVAVFDYGRSFDGLFYYAMEYLDGIDLEYLVRNFGAQPSDRVVSILVQVCGALREAHERGFFHRDIKPANIILCQRGGMPDVAKVVDFGLVKQIESGTGGETAKVVLGTPAYIAPEAVTDPERIGPAVDLYSLGAVGYWLLTGKRLFEGTAVQVCVQHVTKTPVPPSHACDANIPPPLEQLVMSCLAKAAADRPTAPALLRALRGLAVANDWDEDKARRWWLDLKPTDPQATSETPTLTITVDLGERAAGQD